MAKKYKPKKEFSSLLAGLKKKADEQAKTTATGQQSTTGTATVSGSEGKLSLADTTDPNKKQKKSITTDNTGKEGEGRIIYRTDAKTAKEVRKRVIKRALKRGASKVTVTKKR